MWQLLSTYTLPFQNLELCCQVYGVEITYIKTVKGTFKIDSSREVIFDAQHHSNVCIAWMFSFFLWPTGVRIDYSHSFSLPFHRRQLLLMSMPEFRVPAPRGRNSRSWILTWRASKARVEHRKSRRSWFETWVREPPYFSKMLFVVSNFSSNC